MNKYSDPRKLGSTLVVAMIYTAVFSLVIGSILSRVTQERRLVQRSADNASLLYLAEGYVDKAIESINSSEWNGWQQINGGKDRYMQFTTVDLGNRTSQVHALVVNAAKNPTIYAEAVSQSTHGTTRRALRIQYEAERGTTVPGGMIGRGKMEFSGQIYIDSYDSSLGLPSLLNRYGEVTVATTNIASDALKFSDIILYGYAGTGRRTPSISSASYIGDVDGWSGVDWDRVFLDFTYDFPPITEPSWSGSLTSLPSAQNGVIRIGSTSGALTKYNVSKLDMGDGKLQVVGPVEMYLKDGMSIGGTAMIEILQGGSLEVYTPKDVTLSGGGMVNHTGRPQNFKIFGTAISAKDQTISMSGQGVMESVIYAPNAVINLSGQVVFRGSIVGFEMSVSGQVKVHYDVTLGGAPDTTGTSTVAAWHEITSPGHAFNIGNYVKTHGGTFYNPF
jgi:hypothetical protein